MTTATLTENESKLLQLLRDEAEAVPGDDWHYVYLDNVAWDRKSFAGLLGSLAKKGLYRDIDAPQYKGIGGEVRGG